jgi:hypothetical protein
LSEATIEPIFTKFGRVASRRAQRSATDLITAKSSTWLIVKESLAEAEARLVNVASVGIVLKTVKLIKTLSSALQLINLFFFDFTKIITW